MLVEISDDDAAMLTEIMAAYGRAMTARGLSIGTLTPNGTVSALIRREAEIAGRPWRQLWEFHSLSEPH